MLGQIAAMPDSWQQCQAFNVAGHGDPSYAAGLYGLSADGQQPQQMQMPGFNFKPTGSTTADTILGVVGTVGTTYLQVQAMKQQEKLLAAQAALQKKQQQEQQHQGGAGGGSNMLLYSGMALGVLLLGVVIYKVTKTKKSSGSSSGSTSS